MLKRNITYEDYNGNELTETFYFNLSKAELLEFQADYDAGVENVIKRIVETNDTKALIAEFKKLILLSYGEKSDDGKRFVKTPELVEKFTQTAAYSQLFMELASDEKVAGEFINGIIPRDLKEQVEKQFPSEGKPKTTAEIAAALENKSE